MHLAVCLYGVLDENGRVMLQGSLVTLCADSSLHLWQLNVCNGESFIEEVRYLSAETRLSAAIYKSEY